MQSEGSLCSVLSHLPSIHRPVRNHLRKEVTAALKPRLSQRNRLSMQTAPAFCAHGGLCHRWMLAALGRGWDLVSHSICSGSGKSVFCAGPRSSASGWGQVVALGIQSSSP